MTTSTESKYLSQMESDALTELFNIGMGSAVDTLSRLLEQEIQIHIPRSSEIAIQDLRARFIDNQSPFSIILQDFTSSFGDFKGWVMFSPQDSLDIIKKITGEYPLDDELSDFEKGTLLEIGNILLNGCMSTFSHLLKSTLKSSLPRLIHTPKFKLIENITDSHFSLVEITLEFYLNRPSLFIPPFSPTEMDTETLTPLEEIDPSENDDSLIRADIYFLFNHKTLMPLQILIQDFIRGITDYA